MLFVWELWWETLAQTTGSIVNYLCSLSSYMQIDYCNDEKLSTLREVDRDQ